MLCIRNLHIQYFCGKNVHNCRGRLLTSRAHTIILYRAKVLWFWKWYALRMHKTLKCQCKVQGNMNTKSTTHDNSISWTLLSTLRHWEVLQPALVSKLNSFVGVLNFELCLGHIPWKIQLNFCVKLNSRTSPLFLLLFQMKVRGRGDGTNDKTKLYWYFIIY